MTYYETPGVLEDIADFLVDYYNEEYMVKRNKKYDSSTNNFMEFSYELKQMLGSLPQELHPFAYSSDKTTSFITSLIKKVDFVSVTYNSFIEYIKSEAFLNDFCHHWFNNEHEIIKIEDIESYQLRDLIPGLLHPDSIKYQLYLALSDFCRYRGDLINILSCLSGHVKRLRDRHRERIEQSLQIFNEDFFFNHIEHAYSIDVSDYSCCIPLINSGLVYFNYKQKIIFLGQKAYLHCCQSKINNLQTFSFIFHEPLRVKIMEFIHQYQPATFLNVFQHFNDKRTVLRFQIYLLVEEGILNMKQNQDGTLYFSINQEYFKHIPAVFQKTFGLADGKENQEA